MKQTITPFICLNDFEYMDNFSQGWHSHGKGRIAAKTLCVGYPIADWSIGEIKTFSIEEKTYTVGELMRAINKVVVDELAKGSNYAPHIAEDYCIEHITVMDGVVSVEFGS